MFNTPLLVVRLVGSILLIALLALVSALSGDVRAGAAAPAVHATLHVDRGERAEPGFSSEPAEEAESTESLDAAPEDERGGAWLARTANDGGALIAPPFARALVSALAQTTPPAVDRETPTRPPRG